VKFNLTLVPTPTKPCFSVIGNACHIMDRASRVKVQSLSSDTAALAYLFAAAGVANPHVHLLHDHVRPAAPVRGWPTSSASRLTPREKNTPMPAPTRSRAGSA
jgi:hypothetical protein